jgi:hypothetical protein
VGTHTLTFAENGCGPVTATVTVTPGACNPSVNISPTSGPVGTTFTVTGAGWLPGTITTNDSGSGITWPGATADANGNWQTTTKASGNASLDTHTLTFSENGCSNVTQTITITGAGCDVSFDISPGSGPAGSQFTLSGVDWPSGDVLTFNSISGDGDTSGLGLGPVTVGGSGSGSWQETGTIPAAAKVNDVYTIFFNDTAGCTNAQGPSVTFTITP